MAILFKASLDVSVINIDKDKEERMLSLLCQFHEKHFFNTVCLYAPNNPDKQSFTHLSKAHKTYTRIDKIFVSISLLHGLKQTEISQCFYSDHRLVWAELINNETTYKT